MDKQIVVATPFTPHISPARPAPAWPAALPVLEGPRATLRELRREDAGTLLSLMASPDVARFISAPPTSVEQFAAFIGWGQRERIGGRYAGFALLPAGQQGPAGLLQVRQLDPAFHSAEWGFALSPALWGSGLFGEASRLLLRFAFDVLQVQRLEARAAVPNVRAHGALRRLGAVQEGVLRSSLVTATGERFDQVLWTILASEWRHAAVSAGRVH